MPVIINEIEIPTQSDRMAELVTPLGKDKLVLSSFTANEELSSPFLIQVECLSVDENVDFNPALGLNCHVRLNTVGKKTRYYCGVLAEAGWSGEREGLYAYSLVLRPWLWLLTHTQDCRIFQNLSVKDIIEKVFNDAGFNDYKFRLNENYDKIEYCVQYRETHFDFVSRLMEGHGIYYYFEHTEGKHVMVMGDGRGSHSRIAALPKVKFAALGERTRDEEEYLTTWTTTRSFRTGKVMVNAFDFSSPTANLRSDQQAPGGYAHDQMEVYDYPEKYKAGQTSGLGKKFVNARLHSVQAIDQRRYASGDAPSIYPGGLTKLDKFGVEAENREYLVIGASHSFVAQTYSSGATTGEGDSYRGHYVLQKSDRPYKAPLVTDEPKIYGAQTAIVVGKSGEEIWTDKWGRVKLKFHWDRYCSNDEHSSRWVRVAQIWSGKGWGGQFIPRMGMEVLVEFLEGDPDRPVVVGTVYNGDNDFPYKLPDNKTQSGLQTRSSKNGSPSNYNELMFEDKKGEELVRFNAEKDLNSTVEDQEIRRVKGKNKKEVNDLTRHTIIEMGDDVLYVKGNHDVKVDHNELIKIKENQLLKIGGSQFVKIEENQVVKVGKNIKITAGDSIRLICGASKITMTPGTIKIESGTIKIKSSSKTTIDGGGQIIETAGVIKLN